LQALKRKEFLDNIELSKQVCEEGGRLGEGLQGGGSMVEEAWWRLQGGGPTLG
jgi:hypothetical protein